MSPQVATNFKSPLKKPFGLRCATKEKTAQSQFKVRNGRDRDLNPRPHPYHGCALLTERYRKEKYHAIIMEV